MAESCKNMTPPWFTGRWRDWHRGHGCHLDDGKSRSEEALEEINVGGFARGGNPGGEGLR